MKNLSFATPEGSKTKDSVIFLLPTPFSHFWPFLDTGWDLQEVEFCVVSSRLRGPGGFVSI